jgi:hypothetical protein
MWVRVCDRRPRLKRLVAGDDLDVNGHTLTQRACNTERAPVQAKTCYVSSGSGTGLFFNQLGSRRQLEPRYPPSFFMHRCTADRPGVKLRGSLVTQFSI